MEGGPGLLLVWAGKVKDKGSSSGSGEHFEPVSRFTLHSGTVMGETVVKGETNGLVTGNPRDWNDAKWYLSHRMGRQQERFHTPAT